MSLFLPKKIQIILLGDGCVGKTSILNMFSQGNFNDRHLATLGLDCVLA